MIFDRFFKAKHLNSDPEVRLAAIANFSLDKSADKQALHELAFNDSHANVSLAALDKLNSFPLWLKASETAENTRVKKQAYERVLAEVNNPNSTMLSKSDFNSFVVESKNIILLEQMLFSNQGLQNNDVLALAVLLKINKQNTNRLYFKDHANLAQQLVIVTRTDDINELSKMIKFANDDVVKNAIDVKIESLRVLAALPIKLKQEATLVISKLLALKDNGDYEQIYENKEQLCQEFEQYKAQFQVLDEETALLLAEKYLRVNESVEKRLAILKEDWQSTNELKLTTNALSEIDERFKEVKQQIDVILGSIDDPSLLAQSKLLSNALTDISIDIDDATKRPQTVAHKRTIKSLSLSIDTYQGFLKQLPSARETHDVAKALVAQLQAVSDELTDDELAVVLKQLKNEWKHLLAKVTLPLPESTTAAWDEIEKKYRDKISAVQEELKQQEKKTLGKLKTVQRMIDQGSFNAALATFKYAQKMYENLPGQSHKGLSKLYTELNEKTIQLQELQAFIAETRKPALLEEVNALASQKNVESIPDRVNSVKMFRSQWNELGKLGTDEDDALNKRFDEAIEKAFLPCREYYSEQDKIRAENAQFAKTIIDELSALSAHENETTLGRSLSAINKKWRALGNLEQVDRRKLQKGFQSALKPIQLRLDGFYSENLQRKKMLLIKAQQLDVLDDVSSAAEMAKQFQQQWKEIGFSGKQNDDELWLAFRKANDAVFVKVNEKRNTDASELTRVKAEFHELAGTLNEQLSAAREMKDLSDFIANIDVLSQKLSDIPSRQAKTEQQKLDVILQQHQTKQVELEEQKNAAQWQSLFDALAAWTDDNLPQNVDELPNKYKQIMQSSAGKKCDGKRKELTIQSEIIAGLPSNKSDDVERKQLQLQLMAARLQGSDVPTKNELLSEWISCGPLQKTDQALLKRLKKVMLV
ncbi:MAG: exonuclease SbcC [Glaciecola sp.]|jgi:exonuclease SbcC